MELASPAATAAAAVAAAKERRNNTSVRTTNEALSDASTFLDFDTAFNANYNATTTTTTAGTKSSSSPKNAASGKLSSAGGGGAQYGGAGSGYNAGGGVKRKSAIESLMSEYEATGTISSASSVTGGSSGSTRALGGGTNNNNAAETSSRSLNVKDDANNNNTASDAHHANFSTSIERDALDRIANASNGNMNAFGANRETVLAELDRIRTAQVALFSDHLKFDVFHDSLDTSDPATYNLMNRAFLSNFKARYAEKEESLDKITKGFDKLTKKIATVVEKSAPAQDPVGPPPHAKMRKAGAIQKLMEHQRKSTLDHQKNRTKFLDAVHDATLLARIKAKGGETHSSATTTATTNDDLAAMDLALGSGSSASAGQNTGVVSSTITTNNNNIAPSPSATRPGTDDRIPPNSFPI